MDMIRHNFRAYKVRHICIWSELSYIFENGNIQAKLRCIEKDKGKLLDQRTQTPYFIPKRVKLI